MTETFQNILQESDLTEYTGDVIFKYESFLNLFSNTDEFSIIFVIELKKTIEEDKLNRFCFLCHVLFAFGKDLDEYKTIYFYMIGYINKAFTDKSSGEIEQLLIIVLDLLWHQNKGLKELSKSQHESLSLFQRNCAGFKYQIDENGDEIFFAIKKALDLTKFQNDSRERKKIIGIYLTHFDEKIRQESIEMKSINWL